MGKHQYKGVNDGGRGIPALIVDLLETDFGRWHSIDELVGMVELRRPEKTPEQIAQSVHRAVHRLAERGTIESRMRTDFREAQIVRQYRCDWRDYLEREESA